MEKLDKLVHYIWSSLSAISLIFWTIGFIIITGGVIFYFWKYLKFQFNFGKNLRKRIFLLKVSPSKSLQTEKELVKGLNIVKVENEIKDISNDTKILNEIKKNAIWIVGYDENYSKYKDLISSASNNRIPVIIFAKQGEIKKDEHWEIFNNHTYCDIANTTSRLLVIVINLLMVTR